MVKNLTSGALCQSLLLPPLSSHSAAVPSWPSYPARSRGPLGIRRPPDAHLLPSPPCSLLSPSRNPRSSRRLPPPSPWSPTIPAVGARAEATLFTASSRCTSTAKESAWGAGNRPGRPLLRRFLRFRPPPAERPRRQRRPPQFPSTPPTCSG